MDSAPLPFRLEDLLLHGWGPHSSPPGTSGWSFLGVRCQVPSGHALCPAAQPACEEAHRAGGRPLSQGGSDPAHWPGPELGVSLGSGPPQVCPVEPEPDLSASSPIWNPFVMAGRQPRRPRQGAQQTNSNSAASAASGSQEPAELVHPQDGGSWKIRWGRRPR